METQSLVSHQLCWWSSCFSLREKLARSHNKNKNPAKDFLAGFLAGSQINLSVSLNRSKQSLNLDLLGFRNLLRYSII
ncbi:TPA: hypothetical protein TUF52_000099 [Streptococcus equi subsp. zooepidemicus]|nr:hypothetical protein [Streptococcus equi subsp. zooepidemicus]